MVKNKDGKSLHYVNEFLSLKCAPDLMALNLFPNAKEITETLGCFRALKRFFPELFPAEKRNDLIVVVVGDGVVPRTGAFIAHMTPWMVRSIDPEMRIQGTYSSVARLFCLQKKAEDVCARAENLVLVSPHGHVPLKKIVETYKYRTAYIVSMPCCLPDDQMLLNQVGFAYRDTKVLSPQNIIYGWKVEK